MMNAGIPLHYFLILAAIMFFTGVYGFLTRRNLITILMSVELILNSVNINFLAYNRYLYPDKLDGLFFSLFVIAVAAATAITKRLKNNPSSLSGYRYLLYARKLMLTEFKISSTDIKIVIRFLRVRNPYTPVKNIMAARIRK